MWKSNLTPRQPSKKHNPSNHENIIRLSELHYNQIVDLSLEALSSLHINQKHLLLHLGNIYESSFFLIE